MLRRGEKRTTPAAEARSPRRRWSIVSAATVMSARLPAVLVMSDEEDLRCELTDHLAASGFSVGPAEPWEPGPDLVVLASSARASERIRAVQAAQLLHAGLPILTTMPTD